MLDVSKNSAFRRAVITVPALPGNVSCGVVAVLLKALLGLGYSVSKFLSIVCFHGCPSHSHLNKTQENPGKTRGQTERFPYCLKDWRFSEWGKLPVCPQFPVGPQFPGLYH